MVKKQVKTVKNDGLDVPTFVNKNYYIQRKKMLEKQKNLLFKKRIFIGILGIAIFLLSSYFIGYYIMPKIVDLLILGGLL